ncbi:hypothetical protein TELCIR_02178 [Teladorsagia circumcincta]|uniref:Uncharacterized protein n=1 Tax=Teladorsagia circumcincta TaxID=45464 RepID=A0A2G9V1Z5_TELCI|nr:hypothetical protein TELCIR_02178 [Teladorsagia circumcincta]
MLRWTAGITRADHIGNDVIRERFGVTPTVDKMREARLRWYDETFVVEVRDCGPGTGSSSVTGHMPQLLGGVASARRCSPEVNFCEGWGSGSNPRRRQLS